MGVHFEALNGEAKLAIEWKARSNLSMALADGNQMALGNQQKFLENNSESIAANEAGLRQVLLEYREFIATRADDD